MIGIGVEKEILSSNYFSYHYGYKNLKDFKLIENSKLIDYEKKLIKYFKNIDFNVIFLNVSCKGDYVNFSMKEKGEEIYNNVKKYLMIERYKDADSFSIRIDDINNPYKLHREIYTRPVLEDFNINRKKINSIVKDFDPDFFAIGFDVQNKIPILNDIHLELYPKRSISSSDHFINTLKRYGVSNTDKFKKYLFKFKKFSHIKIRIKEDQISNIKYYRSINVNVPEFYYE